MRTVHWTRDLSNSTTPGTYPVEGGGQVDVTQDNIDAAAQYGGDVLVELLDVTSPEDTNSSRRFIVDPFQERTADH